MLTRTLRVETPKFPADVEWTFDRGHWRCTRTAPNLNWMKGLSMVEALAKLERLRYKFSWLSSRGSATEHQSLKLATRV